MANKQSCKPFPWDISRQEKGSPFASRPFAIQQKKALVQAGQAVSGQGSIQRWPEELRKPPDCEIYPSGGKGPGDHGYEPHAVAQYQQSGPVVQRAIVIEGRTYGEEDLEEFEKSFSEENRGEMLSAMSDFERYPRSIAAALADPRRFYLTAQNDGDQVYYSAEADALPKPVEGGTTREAGRRAILVTRPSKGFEELKISGLIMCIGVVVEARVAGMIQAASGAHFVTPRCISDSKINENGQSLLEEQVRMVEPHGTLSATLMCAKGPGDKGTEDQRQASQAIELITSFLQSRGVVDIEILGGASKRFYQLKEDGSSALR